MAWFKICNVPNIKHYEGLFVFNKYKAYTTTDGSFVSADKTTIYIHTVLLSNDNISPT